MAGPGIAHKITAHRIYRGLGLGLAVTAAMLMATAAVAGGEHAPFTVDLTDASKVTQDATLPKEIILRDVTSPTLDVYLPAPAIRTGAAIVICPGGALRMLMLDADLNGMVRWFNDRGVAVFVLKYHTLPSTGDKPASFALPKSLDITKANANPDPSNQALTDTFNRAVKDGQDALGYIRKNAQSWGVNPKSIGMMGYSAGGGVALGTLLKASPDTRPAYVVSLFGPSLMDVDVPADAPPLFLAVDANHGPVTAGIEALYKTWKQAGKSAELHVLDVPMGGFKSELWRDDLQRWADRQHLGFDAGNRSPVAAAKE